MCDFVARTNWSNIESKLFCRHHNNLQPLLLHEYNNYFYILQSSDTVLYNLFFPPKYYLHKSCTIFHINLYVFNIHTEISNVTNELYHVKRSPIFQNKPFQIPYNRMNHLCRDWNKRMLTIVRNTICNSCA